MSHVMEHINFVTFTLLLFVLQAAGMVPNVEICEILLFQSHLDFNYKLDLLRVMKSFDIRPSEKMIEKLEKSIQFARKKIVLKVC